MAFDWQLYEDFSWKIYSGLAAVVCLCVYAFRRWNAPTFYRGTASLTGKTVIVTGSNTGIGYESALNFARRGGRVILACRNRAKGEEAAAKIRQLTGNEQVVFRLLDNACQKSVREFAKVILREEARLDILVHNAGVSRCHSNEKTESGYDLQFGINHLNPFLLTQLLLPLLRKTAPSRVLVVSSVAHKMVQRLCYLNTKQAWEETIAYSTCKLCNILFAAELARRLKGTGVTAYSLHPGMVDTRILHPRSSRFHGRLLLLFCRNVLRPFCISLEASVQTTLYCALDPSVTQHSGRYFADCRLAKESKLARDEKIASQLWDLSCKLTGTENY
ncbi:retinol dehydrogenase 12-like [Acanthaster planci]|uniref:Retinol dehydrogenase 12-like n=1 Tax=Acanthaster planci TaxID=133434 RepID=A0A8B7YSG9_ACAPL|nr:retinol dehydrogenase 12-like [Acanthaster planci]